MDDEVSNLAIMDAHFAQAGYQMLPAQDGMIALQKLEENPDIAAIVLDKSMPNLGGMAFLQKIKADARFADMPVVMLTAAATVDEAVEGIAAGVRYYLTKPYSGAMLIEIVNLALQEVRNIKSLKEEHKDIHLGLGMMQQARFHFRTLEEAANLAYHIADCFPEPQKAAFGLNELMRNAVEHGKSRNRLRRKSKPPEKRQLARRGRTKTEFA